MQKASTETIAARARDVLNSLEFLRMCDREGIDHSCLSCKESDPDDIDELDFIWCNLLQSYTPPDWCNCGNFYPRELSAIGIIERVGEGFDSIGFVRKPTDIHRIIFWLPEIEVTPEFWIGTEVRVEATTAHFSP